MRQPNECSPILIYSDRLVYQFFCTSGCRGYTSGSDRHQKPTSLGPLPSRTRLPNLPLRSSISLRVSWGFFLLGDSVGGGNLTSGILWQVTKVMSNNILGNSAYTGKHVLVVLFSWGYKHLQFRENYFI